MTYPLTQIDGLTAAAASKLKAAGIRTTEKLLDAAATAKGRKALSEKTGIPAQQLLDWANAAHAMLIPGVGKANIGLLRAAGVSTVRELGFRNPERLAAAMAEANKTRKLVRGQPTAESVGKIIERARKLPPKISY